MFQHRKVSVQHGVLEEIKPDMRTGDRTFFYLNKIAENNNQSMEVLL
jgi:hypothetical protein